MGCKRTTEQHIDVPKTHQCKYYCHKLDAWSRIFSYHQRFQEGKDMKEDEIQRDIAIETRKPVREISDFANLVVVNN